MRKRGGFNLGQEMIYMVITFIIILVGILILSYMAGTGSSTSKSTHPLLAELEAAQLIDNPDCFAYEHPTGRVDKGTIDQKKFNETRLQTCLLTGMPMRQTPAKATLLDIHTKKTTNYQTPVWTSPSSTTQTITRDVFIKTGNEIHEGTLTIQINPLYFTT